MQLKSLGLAAVAVLAIVLPASAHHSHANYEAIKWLDIKGKVTEMQWLNPHVWLYVDVKNTKGDTPGDFINRGGQQDIRIFYIALLKEHGIVSDHDH